MTHVNVFLKKPGVIVSAGWLVSQGYADLFMIILYNIVHDNRSQAIAFYSYLNYMIKLKSGIETT